MIKKKKNMKKKTILYFTALVLLSIASLLIDYLFFGFVKEYLMSNYEYIYNFFIKKKEVSLFAFYYIIVKISISLVFMIIFFIIMGLKVKELLKNKK